MWRWQRATSCPLAMIKCWPNTGPIFWVSGEVKRKDRSRAGEMLVKCWFAFQLLMVLMFLTYWFANIQSIGLNQMFWYGSFIFLSIYAITEQMDHSLTAPWFEGLRLAFGVLVIVFTGDWFGVSAFWTGAPFLIVTYLTFSFILSVLIYRSDKNSSITV